MPDTGTPQIGYPPTPPGSPAITGDDILTRWRHRAIDIVLCVALAIDTPVLVYAATGHAIRLHPVELACYIGSVVLLVLALALRSRLSIKARAGVFFGTALGVAIIWLLRSGTSGIGTPFLIALPPLAFLMAGAVAGRHGLALTTAVYFAWAAAASTGALDRFTDLPAPSTLGLRLFLGVAMLLLAVPLMVLLENLQRFMLHTVEAEREAARLAAAESRRNAALNAALQREAGERRRLERALLDTHEAERRRIGAELHDGVCQELTGALLRTRVAEKDLRRAGSESADNVAAVAALLDQALEQSQELARGLASVELKRALVPALEGLARRVRETRETDCVLEAPPEAGDVDAATATQLFRIAQEAVTNALKHARAERIALRLRREEGALVLEVADDGRGIAPEPDGTEGVGLRIMRYRAETLGGRLEVQSGPGGTLVACRVPRAPRGLSGEAPADARRAAGVG